jgi:hypothetical protein
MLAKIGYTILTYREENKYGVKLWKVTRLDASTIAVAVVLEGCVQF